MLFSVQTILRFNLGVAFFKSMSIFIICKNIHFRLPVLYVNVSVKPPVFVQNDFFSILAVFCNQSNRLSQINMKPKHLDHSSNKTFCKVTFNFWLPRGPNKTA